MADSVTRDEMDQFIDQALVALGGEDTEFYVAVKDGAVLLDCRYQDCPWGITVGEMELWEFVADAREHWQARHAAEAAPVVAG